MELRTERLILRPWRRGDEAALVREANDMAVWRTVRDRFPHPYTVADAERWIDYTRSQPGPPRHFAIVHGGTLIGGVGFELKEDVHRCTSEVGYWLGRAWWGRGFATEAVRRIVAYAFETFDSLTRLEAHAFASNPASARVLEKAGFVLEARLSRAVIKQGVVQDELVYALLRG
jgi:ribosomal-protein-alanine N-acetyltransferase